MTAAAPFSGLQASALAGQATPGRTASVLAHLAIGAALLAAPGVKPPEKPPKFVLVDVAPPPLPIQPPPPPEPRATKPQPRPALPPPTPAPERVEQPAFAAPPMAPRAAPLAAASAIAAPTPQAQDAPFLADVGARAEALAPAPTTAPALSAVEENSAFVGASSERIDTLNPQTAPVPTRDLTAARAAPEAMEFSSEAPPAETAGLDADAQKRAEEEARRLASMKAPAATSGDAPIQAGGSRAGAAASVVTGGARGGGAPTSGGSAAIRGIMVDGLNESFGCDNPDDVRLSEEERAACNRRRWAGARSAAPLGAVRPRDGQAFDAALARKTPPPAGQAVTTCKGAGAAGATDCLPDPATTPKQR